MIDILRWGARAPAVLALPFVLAWGQDGSAQLPGPIPGFDENTVALGTFETSVALIGPDGVNLIKSTAVRHPAGMFDTPALAMPASGGVSIHHSEDFQLSEGTIEMWVRRGQVTDVRQTLFALQGLNTLDGGPYKALIVGEASERGPALSRVLFNSGNGLDLANAALFRSQVPRGIAVGDVDADGHRDLVVSMHAGSGVHIFLGPIEPGVIYSGPDIELEVPEPQGNTLADLDGDGDLDLLVCSYESMTAPVYGFENQGDGSFLPLDLNFFGFGAFAEGMAVGDVNRDGVLDVLFANLDTTNPGAVLHGFITDEGRWSVDITEDELFSPLSFVTLGACLADVNSDGWLDAILTRPLDDEVVVHINAQDGTFRELPEFVISTAAPFTVSGVKDVNNDGYTDIAVANWITVEGENSFMSRIHLGPAFVETIDFPIENAVSFTLGDIDGDGWNDLFLRSSTGSTSRLYYLDGQGEIRGARVIPTSPTVGTVNGPGMGVFAGISGGTTPYASVLDDSNSFELFLENGDVHFRITDRLGRAHQVSASFPITAGGPGGFRHVSAEWALHSGLLQLRVQPTSGASVVTYLANGPIEVSRITPQFRLGTDFDNQQACRGCRFDDVRISNVRRSEVDLGLGLAFDR